MWTQGQYLSQLWKEDWAKEKLNGNVVTTVALVDLTGTSRVKKAKGMSLWSPLGFGFLLYQMGVLLILRL